MLVNSRQLEENVLGPQDPSRGTFGVVFNDCAGRAAAGVKLTSAQLEGATLLYIDGGVPVAGRTETSADGWVVVTNVAPGIMSLNAELAATGKVVATATVRVRADTATAVVLAPTPTQ